ncbi:NifU family protein [Mycolicibacterium aichiense]|uniref:NifU family protein n=1 Tax=Mycolicibacterium aichiense TaxID=1799 RepID=UPI003D66F583
MSTTTERPVAEPTFEDLAKRVDDAVAALGDLDPSARAVAEELKAAIEQIHRAALVTMVRRMRSDDPARDVLFELVDDPTVHLLLSLHGIVRPDPVTHANQVLASVRPQLHSHGGDVTLVRVDDGTAYVRLEGACNGCSMSAVTLRNLVEEALVQGVPAISAVEVLPNEPTPTLIPIEALRIGRDPAGDGWVELGPAAGLAVDDLSPRSVTTAGGGSAEVIVVNAGRRLSAYRNECAHEALPLDNAILDLESNTLTCPWHGFCYDATSGECLSAPGAQLEQLPLRVDGGVVWVRVGG